MKIKPSMKKPQLDMEAEAMKFAAGGAHEETPDTQTQDSKKHHAQKESSHKKKSGQGGSAASGIKIKGADNGYCTILAEGSMNIYAATQQKSVLLEALQKHRHLEIDLSEVDEMDTAGLQLLLLLRRTAAQTGKSISLVAHSPASLDVIDRYDLAAYFGDPVIISPIDRRSQP